MMKFSDLLERYLSTRDKRNSGYTASREFEEAKKDLDKHVDSITNAISILAKGVLPEDNRKL